MPDEKKEPKKAEKKVEVEDLDAKEVKTVQGGVIGSQGSVIEFQGGDDLSLRKRPGRSS